MSLTTPESVQKLQAALHDKAKKSPNFRFYALYDKVYRKDVLTFAYQSCKANGGAAGVDNQTFEDIEAYGAEPWLDELTQELKSQKYRPLPVRRVYIFAGNSRVSQASWSLIKCAVPQMRPRCFPKWPFAFGPTQLECLEPILIDTLADVSQLGRSS